MPGAGKSYAILMVAASLLVGLFSYSALAEQTDVPAAIKGAVNVDAEEVINLAETLPGLVIIDSRIAADRIHGYIEGSISLPNTETTCATLAKHIKTFNTPSLYYCNGPKCGRSVKAINIALGCGYTKIYWYRGGFEDWKAKEFPYIMNEK